MELVLAGSLEYAIRPNSLVDGEGLRVLLYTAGCPHRCPGCHNPNTWNLKNGQKHSIETIVDYLLPLLEKCDGITLTGGDPLVQVEAITELLLQLRREIPSLNVWCYTGYTFETLPQGVPLSLIDVLVDGKFERENRYPLKPFRGSRNQRLIYLKEGLPIFID